jgi:hypothetical protein
METAGREHVADVWGEVVEVAEALGGRGGKIELGAVVLTWQTKN